MITQVPITGAGGIVVVGGGGGGRVVVTGGIVVVVVSGGLLSSVQAINKETVSAARINFIRSPFVVELANNN